MLRYMLLLTIACSVTLAQDDADNTDPTIKDVMLNRITSASNTIWGVEDPQSDAEWQVFDDAALALIEDFEQLRKGGGGTNDSLWAGNASWQAYIDEEMAALSAARQAIDSRDLEKLWEANDALYTPCETCHIEFNPGVASENR